MQTFENLPIAALSNSGCVIDWVRKSLYKGVVITKIAIFYNLPNSEYVETKIFFA